MPAQVVVRNGQGYLTGVPAEAMPALRKATSFRPAGFQFSKKFNTYVGSGDRRKRAWDGRVKLLKHSKFPGGLLDTILDVLKAEGVTYDLQVDRMPDLPHVRMSTVDLESRDYQDEALEHVALNPRGIVRAPTGSGKTAIGGRVIEFHKKRTLVIVPTIDLLHQYRAFLGKHLIVGFEDPQRIGQLGDGVVDPQEVTVATVRTAAKAMGVAYETYEYGEYDDKDDTEVNPAKLRGWIDGIGVLIVDEAHILGAETVYNVATKLKAPFKYGMSASPWRDDGADLMIEAATGRLIYRVGVDRLVDEGHLVPPIIRVVDTKGMWRPAAWDKNQFGKAYKHEIVDNPVRNDLIAKHAQQANGATLVLVKQVNHGRILEGLIPESLFLSGQDSGSRRSEVYEDLRTGQLKTIIATTIADLGLDLPICRNLILAGGGKSSTRHLQRIGRVARPYPGKTHANVIDYDDSHVHKWFRTHARERRKIEAAEWGTRALWV